MSCYAVIMAGGSGTRFWPLSRKQRPKQLLPIGTERPLIAESFERLGTISPWSQRFVVAGSLHREGILESCPELPPEQLLIEPCARNTAPCVGLAALLIHARDPDAVLAVLPADHHIRDVETFQGALRVALEGANQGELVTIGIEPTRPETGYGYLHYDPSQKKGGSLQRLPVHRFIEKPDRERAQQYLESGEYLWNGGMFFFRADRILNEIKLHLPALSEGLDALRAQIGRPTFQSALEEIFPTLPSVSIDVGVMERAGSIQVVPADMGWNDVGHWAALKDFAPVDEAGNRLSGAARERAPVLIDARENIVHSESATISLVGVEGLVVVQTEDAVLVCPRERAQDVRAVVDLLKMRGEEELL